MKQVLFDTNVVLDVLLNREPWVNDAKKLWEANDKKQIVGYITASTITDIFYISRRLTDLDVAYTAIHNCLRAFKICPVNRDVLQLALTYPSKDFEDNLQMACAELQNLDTIITRNISDFQTTKLSVLIPSDALAQLK